jgi:NapC/NirT cytochrome c family, N-terminal region
MTPPELAVLPRRLWRNRVTLAGGALALASLLFILSLLFFDLVSAQPSPYLGLFTFLILPGFMAAGVGLIVVGMIAARSRFKREYGALDLVEYYPHVDLNDPAQRRVLLITGVCVAAAIPFIGLMSYQGYEYTDSNAFCGAVCHTVMQPQYVAHGRGAHARVDCATCHIGRGASWYVKSKISGVRQVFAVTLDTYRRPLPAAITELRPARETCEQCHWPEKFYGDQLVTIEHFASDEGNTPRQLRMIVKTGGGDPTTGPPSGIHWHMAVGHTIEFVAVDDALQDIRWMRSVDHATGAATVYRSDGLTATDPPPAGVRRRMDCMDCHNRATHVFRSPSLAADQALHVHAELRALPYAKRELVAATAVDSYPSREEAFDGVAEKLRSFYEKEYPEIVARQPEDLDRLVAAGREIVGRSYFPAMRVDWRTYPNNIGHLIFPGCFRCHDGQHLDERGTPLSHRCSTCHLFEVPAQIDGAEELVETAGFKHPIALAGKHAALRCDRCHTGGVAPDPTCAGCHADTAAFRAGSLEALSPFAIEAEPMDGTVECEDCHDPSAPMDDATLQAACINCHPEPEYERMVTAWKEKVGRLLAQAEGSATPAQQTVIDALRQAGPLHNIDATVKVLTALTRQEAGAPPPRSVALR